VAQRDIQEGEELFLDYGPTWEAAWQDYQRQWEQSLAQRAHPWQSEDAKEQYRHQPLETAATIRPNSYPRHIATACFLQTRDRPDGVPMRDGQLDITEWAGPATLDRYQGNRLFVVDVVDRYEAPGFFYNYTVNARVAVDRLEQVVNVPHAACTFVNSPYTSDMHMPGAFRHAIGIIDSHFPQMWRDKR
jgi:hypothetical protein